MDSERIKELEDENKELTEKNLYLQKTCEELKGIIRTAASTSERAVSEQLKVCGCVEIEGTRTSAAYQDMVGILLCENYTVQLKPLDDRKRLKLLFMKERYKNYGTESINHG